MACAKCAHDPGMYKVRNQHLCATCTLADLGYWQERYMLAVALLIDVDTNSIGIADAMRKLLVGHHHPNDLRYSAGVLDAPDASEVH